LIKLIESTKTIQTPEGVPLALTPAGPGARALAWLIDFMAKSIIIFGFSIISSIVLQKAALGAILIFIFLIEWFYPVWFETRKQGMTPGKKSTSIRVLHDDGTPITLESSLLRNLLLCVDFFPGFYGLALLSMLTHRDFKRLGDIVAGTLVVHVNKKPQTHTRHNIPKVSPANFPIPLENDEQKALTSYAERFSGQTQARNKELANILEPITKLKNEEATQKLLSYANSIMGRR
jgi:uncharacterized RDD family membrane protein YckC